MTRRGIFATIAGFIAGLLGVKQTKKISLTQYEYRPFGIKIMAKEPIESFIRVMSEEEKAVWNEHVLKNYVMNPRLY